MKNPLHQAPFISNAPSIAARPESEKRSRESLDKLRQDIHSFEQGYELDMPIISNNQAHVMLYTRNNAITNTLWITYWRLAPFQTVIASERLQGETDRHLNPAQAMTEAQFMDYLDQYLQQASFGHSKGEQMIGYDKIDRPVYETTSQTGNRFFFPSTRADGVMQSIDGRVLEVLEKGSNGKKKLVARISQEFVSGLGFTRDQIDNLIRHLFLLGFNHQLLPELKDCLNEQFDLMEQQKASAAIASQTNTTASAAKSTAKLKDDSPTTEKKLTSGRPRGALGPGRHAEYRQTGRASRY